MNAADRTYITQLQEIIRCLISRPDMNLGPHSVDIYAAEIGMELGKKHGELFREVMDG
jgi:hypothetical protein